MCIRYASPARLAEMIVCKAFTKLQFPAAYWRSELCLCFFFFFCCFLLAWLHLLRFAYAIDVRKNIIALKGFSHPPPVTQCLDTILRRSNAGKFASKRAFSYVYVYALEEAIPLVLKDGAVLSREIYAPRRDHFEINFCTIKNCFKMH